MVPFIFLHRVWHLCKVEHQEPIPPTPFCSLLLSQLLESHPNPSLSAFRRRVNHQPKPTSTCGVQMYPSSYIHTVPVNPEDKLKISHSEVTEPFRKDPEGWVQGGVSWERSGHGPQIIPLPVTFREAVSLMGRNENSLRPVLAWPDLRDQSLTGGSQSSQYLEGPLTGPWAGAV